MIVLTHAGGDGDDLVQSGFERGLRTGAWAGIGALGQGAGAVGQEFGGTRPMRQIRHDRMLSNLLAEIRHTRSRALPLQRKAPLETIVSRTLGVNFPIDD